MILVQPVNTSECLEKICESNFKKLFCLIPEFSSFKSQAVGKAANNPTLHLTIIERSKHTITAELSHSFKKNMNEVMEPAVKIRVYLDANLAEVLRDHERPLVSTIYKDPMQSVEIMNYKWRLNYFLQKWLDHCLKAEYKFLTQEMERTPILQ